jgi:hypothetical protein
MLGSRNELAQRGVLSSSAAAAPPPKKQTQIVVGPNVSAATVTSLVLDLLISANLPFNLVSDPAVAKLINAFMPSYKLPDRTTMARKAEERYNAELAEERALFTVHGARGISLSTCCHSHGSTESY